MRYSEILSEKKKKRHKKRTRKAVLPRYYGYWGIPGFQSAGVESGGDGGGGGE